MIIIINCILSTALLPDNTTGETFHHDGRADIGSQFIHRFLVCCHLLCDIQRRTFSSVFQRVFDQRFNVGINTSLTLNLSALTVTLFCAGSSRWIPRLML